MGESFHLNFEGNSSDEYQFEATTASAIVKGHRNAQGEYHLSASGKEEEVIQLMVLGDQLLRLSTEGGEL